MVDVSGKPVQRRTATASGRIRMSREAAALVAENRVKKGDVLAAAEIAGIQAAKKTAELIPLCHPLPIGKVDVKADPVEDGVTVAATVVSIGQTGVEMEALTAVSAALLTVYDMCKAVDKRMTIGKIVLLEKRKTDVG